VPHLDPDRLVLIALGEQDPSTAETEHLHHCDSCRHDLTATRATVTVGRESQHVPDLPAPPEDLWRRIAAAAFPASPADPDPLHPLPPRRSLRSVPGLRLPRAVPGLRPYRSVPGARPPRRTSPRSRLRSWPDQPGRWRPALTAAAAALLVAAVGVAVIWAHQGPTDRIVAQADLLAQPSAPATARGRATIVDTGHGLQMRVTMSGMPTPTGYYAVWLYDGRTVMIPIGSPGEAPLNVPPAATNLARFTIVDISSQQLGEQQHGTSMLQGHLHP
jgi:hypothetical protein